MMLIMRGLSLMLLVFLVGEVAFPQAVYAESMNKTIPLPAFHAIDVLAPVNVTLHTGHRRAQIVLHGDSEDIKHLLVTVKKGVLQVTRDQHEAHFGHAYVRGARINIDIYTQALRGLKYQGNGTLTGHGIQTRALDAWIKGASHTQLDGRINLQRLTLEGARETKISGITSQNMDVMIANASAKSKTYLDGQVGLHQLTVKGAGYTQITGVKGYDLRIKLIGNPKVQLTGRANMTWLDMTGDSMFSFYWVESNTLVVRARKGARIQLAGIAERLDVELWGHARFNGRYLRATRAFVKTHDHAFAELSATSRQHTLAMDASDIYFYNLSTYRTDFMGQNGAVLDMRDWELAFEQESTRYNK